MVHNPLTVPPIPRFELPLLPYIPLLGKATAPWHDRYSIQVQHVSVATHNGPLQFRYLNVSHTLQQYLSPQSHKCPSHKPAHLRPRPCGYGQSGQTQHRCRGTRGAPSHHHHSPCQAHAGHLPCQSHQGHFHEVAP